MASIVGDHSKVLFIHMAFNRSQSKYCNSICLESVCTGVC